MELNSTSTALLWNKLQYQLHSFVLKQTYKWFFRAICYVNRDINQLGSEKIHPNCQMTCVNLRALLIFGINKKCQDCHSLYFMCVIFLIVDVLSRFVLVSFTHQVMAARTPSVLPNTKEQPIRYSFLILLVCVSHANLFIRNGWLPFSQKIQKLWFEVNSNFVENLFTNFRLSPVEILLFFHLEQNGGNLLTIWTILPFQDPY